MIRTSLVRALAWIARHCTTTITPLNSEPPHPVATPSRVTDSDIAECAAIMRTTNGEQWRQQQVRELLGNNTGILDLAEEWGWDEPKVIRAVAGSSAPDRARR